MRKKIIYIAIVIMQIITLVFFINSKSGITDSPKKITLQTGMIELQRFTENNMISLSYPINKVSSLETECEIVDYKKNDPIYIKLKPKAGGWIAVYFGMTRPEVSEGEILIHGNIADIVSKKQYTFSYKKNGKSYQSDWMGSIRKAKSCKLTYVELEPLTKAKIVDISKGYILKLSFGIENYLLQSEQKHKLNELIDQFGDTDVSVEAAVDESGDMALTAIFIGKEKVAL